MRSDQLTVNFKVTGPFSIFRGHAAVGRARKDQTWMDFLVNSCELQIPRHDGLRIQTRTLVRRTKCNGQSAGWTAELDEKIGEFVKKYERKRAQYSVMLIDGIRANSNPPNVVDIESDDVNVVDVIAVEDDSDSSIVEIPIELGPTIFEEFGDSDADTIIMDTGEMETAIGNSVRAQVLRNLGQMSDDYILEVRKQIEDLKRRNLTLILRLVGSMASLLSFYSKTVTVT